MENVPPPAESPDPLRLCPVCRTPNDDWLRSCLQCGAALPSRIQAVRAEIAHISYLLWQIPGWLTRNLLTSENAARLHDEYTRRQNGMHAQIATVSGAVHSTQGFPPPVVPALPVARSPSHAAMSYAPMAQPQAFPASPQRPPISPPAPPQPNPSNASTPPPTGVDVRGIAIFLQEHALKIVFALATVLVLISLRSILGWNASHQVYLALLPLLTIGLTAMFWQFGRRTQEENPWAGFVYQGLAAVMLSFDLLIANRFWLGALGMLVQPKPITFVACALSTATCALFWRRHRYAAMWHLLQAGLLTTLFMTLQGVKLVLWDQLNWRPTPLPLFGLAYLGAAAIYFAIAIRERASNTTTGSDPVVSRYSEWSLWANLSVGVAFGLSALGLSLGHGVPSDDLLSVLLVGGLLYGFMAQALANSRMVYAAAALCLGSGLIWTPSHLPLGASSYSALLLTFSTVALALTTYNRRAVAHRRLAEAWKRPAFLGNTLSLMVTGGQILLSFLTTPTEPSGSMPLRVGIMLVCGTQFLYAMVQERDTSSFYPACLAFGIALLGGLQVLHAATTLYPFALTCYAALLLLLPFYRQSLTEAQDAPLLRQRHLWNVVRLCGKIMLGISLATSALFAIESSHSPWLSASLLLGCALAGFLGSQEAIPHWRYTTLFGSAYTCSLLTQQTLATSLTLSVGLLPFVLLSSIGAFIASRSLGKASPSGRLAHQRDLWRDPLVEVGLIAVAVSLFAAWADVHRRIVPPYIALEAIGCMTAALLLAAARPVGAKDGRRIGALVLLNIATSLLIAHAIGMTAIGHTGDLAVWNRFAYGLLLQGWGYWLAARLLHNVSTSEVWSEDLALVAIAPAFLGGLFATVELFVFATQWAEGLTPPIVNIASAYLLIHLETLRSRRTELVVLSGSILLLAGIALTTANSRIQPYLATSMASLTILATESYLQLAQRLKNSTIGAYTALPLLGGICLALIQSHAHHLGAQDITIANLVWIVGGLALAWKFLSAAKWSGQSGFAYASGIVLIVAYLHAVTWALPLSAAWIALQLLPLLVGMAALSLHPPRGMEPIHRVYMTVAATASILALLWTSLYGDIPLLSGHAATPDIVTLTLAIYGAAYFALAAARKTAALFLGGSTCTLAYLNFLVSKTDWYTSGASALSWPIFAFLAIQAALVWVGVGAFLRRRSQDPALALSALSLAQAVALFSAVVAVLSLHAPAQGTWCILTLAWAGGIWFALWTLEQGEICLHIGVGNLLIAWCATIYHLLGAQIDLLDVYLLPFGLYLLFIGHQVSRRQKQQEAQTFWWMGLLVTLTPTLLTRWMHAPGWQAALLISECIVCVLWGISQRIRAFVAAGLGVLVVYAASVSLGNLPDAITTILALLTGVGLFVFGFYALTHQEKMKRLAAALQQRWRVWHSWR